MCIRDRLLREGKVAPTAPLVQFTRLVFENNYLQSESRRDIYHQTYGIAMGTPFTVTAANAFVYYRPRDIIELCAQHLTLYKGFIDDIFVIWAGTREIILEFLSATNAKDEGIQFTYEISGCKISFLDCFFSKILLVRHCNTLPFKKKKLNKYLCIPFESFHPTSNKKFKGELMWYPRNSSSFSSFTETPLLF